MSKPKELFVTSFPCGAFRASRSLGEAKLVGLQVAGARTCCEEGHGSFEVHRYQPSSAEGPRAAYAVVIPIGRKP